MRDWPLHCTNCDALIPQYTGAPMPAETADGGVLCEECVSPKYASYPNEGEGWA